MRTEIEVDPREISGILRIINEYLNEKIFMKDLLIEILKKGVSSSDYLFIILSKLQDMGLVEGKHGVLFIKKKIDVDIDNRIKNNLIKEISKKKKIFVTPLEVAKFYQCPRRFYLEKIVSSRQFKRKRGKVWDGEVLHLAVHIFIENLFKNEVEELIKKIPRFTLNKYIGKTTLSEKDIEDFLSKLHQLIREEKFNLLLSERTLLSIKDGLMGTADIIAKNEEDEFIPIDIKLGNIDRRGIKKEHLLQSTGEALLVEDFLRTRINASYLIYFQAGSAVKIKLDNLMKKEFISYKKMLEKVSIKKMIPSMSNLPNARNRVCKGCHVKPTCDNIEELNRLKGR